MAMAIWLYLHISILHMSHMAHVVHSVVLACEGSNRPIPITGALRLTGAGARASLAAPHSNAHSYHSFHHSESTMHSPPPASHHIPNVFRPCPLFLCDHWSQCN